MLTSSHLFASQTRPCTRQTFRLRKYYFFTTTYQPTYLPTNLPSSLVSRFLPLIPSFWLIFDPLRFDPLPFSTQYSSYISACQPSEQSPIRTVVAAFPFSSLSSSFAMNTASIQRKHGRLHRITADARAPLVYAVALVMHLSFAFLSFRQFYTPLSRFSPHEHLIFLARSNSCFFNFNILPRLPQLMGMIRSPTKPTTAMMTATTRTPSRRA